MGSDPHIFYGCYIYVQQPVVQKEYNIGTVCSKCDKEAGEDVHFCPKCGHVMVDRTRQYNSTEIDWSEELDERFVSWLDKNDVGKGVDLLIPNFKDPATIVHEQCSQLNSQEFDPVTEEQFFQFIADHEEDLARLRELKEEGKVLDFYVKRGLILYWY